MKTVKSFVIIFFSCAGIFLFSDATGVSAKQLRKSNANWYLQQNIDSATFFSADTLKFESFGNVIRPDTFALHPQIRFGTFQKNEFAIYLGWKNDTINKGPWHAQICTLALRGKYFTDEKNNIVTFDFYNMDKNHPTDHINDWIKYDSKKYRIATFSKTSLVLVKIKTE